MKHMKKMLAIAFSLTMLAGVSTLGITQETATAEIAKPRYQQAASTQQASKGLGYYLSDNGTYYIVTGIGSCTDTELVIPDTYEGLPVREIGDYVFVSCVSLTSVTIPDSVTSIGEGAFFACTNLTSVTIPDSVTSIGNYAFFYCESLTSVTIGDSVTSIGDSVFSYCTSLTNITVDENNAKYSSLDGNLYNKDQTELIQYAVGKTATLFTIPGSVTSIGDSAFYSCDSLTSVTIPDSVTSIGEIAFADCDSLTSVTIGDSVTSIGESAFSSCTSLTSVTIPDSVTSIGDSVFYSCTSLTSVKIPDSVTSIGGNVFYSCTSLTSVTIGDSVTSIGGNAFCYCDSLTSIEVDKNNTKYSSLDGDLYNKDQTELIQYAIGKTATSFTIPNSVTSIGLYAFSFCTSLTSVSIPDSVTSIGIAAFANCDSLTSVTIPDSVTRIGSQAFYDCDSLTSITFKGTRAQWVTIKKGEDWNYNVPAKVVCLGVEEIDNNTNDTSNGCFGTAGVSTCLALMGLSVSMFIKKKDEE